MALRRGALGALALSFAAVASSGPVAGAATDARVAAPAPQRVVRYDDLPDGVAPNYVTGAKWNKTNLTYRFVNDTPDISGTVVERQAIRDGMAMWARVSPLRFTEVTSGGDMLISFRTGNHGDGHNFDGPFGVLAHGYYPPPQGNPYAGDVHFDDAETWTANTDAVDGAQPFDLVIVAAHEVGHALGLNHSADSSALMAPSYNSRHRYLSADDINGVRHLYGNVSAATGYVWAGSPTLASYTPNPAYSYNSAGGTNTIQRLGLGYYQVNMPSLGQANGNVVVTAHGSTARRCKVESWGANGSNLRVFVRCYTMTGVPADNQFVAQYRRNGPKAAMQSAYVFANNAISASYTPSLSFQYNSTGGTNTITRQSAGAYTVRIPGFTGGGGNVQVTAYGTTSHYCKVASWTTGTVSVRCFTPSGAAADALFTMSYTRDHVANQGQQGAYVWANDPTDSEYIPDRTFQWYARGAHYASIVYRTGVGAYRVSIPYIIASNKTTPMVTAQGSTSSSCQTSSWSDDNGFTEVGVRCFTASGTPVNTAFNLSYLTNAT